jgi:hypothetical protein
METVRRVLPLIIVGAAVGCTQTTVSKLDDRTYNIVDSGVPGGSTAPDRRAASQICPSGYRVLNQRERRNTRDGYSEDNGQVFTEWTIRCL